MPELPEVETTRCGIEPHVIGRTVTDVIVRESRLRWPVEKSLALCLRGDTFYSVQRRAKYLLLQGAKGCVIMHLGMSGSLRILPVASAAGKHDHIDIVLNNETCLRLHDPRRFGAVLWTAEEATQHPLLRRLGPEPLADEFTGLYLYQRARNRAIAVKHYIMDSTIVAGIGNIYANEALFQAHINPRRAAGRISVQRFEALAASIRYVLSAALACGGTTLRDYCGSDGKAGYFKQQLMVYDRAGFPCPQCGKPLIRFMQTQRATYCCSYCQR